MLATHQGKDSSHSAPVVDAARCHVCRRCPAREACRPKAVTRIDRDEAPFVDPRRCFGCRACILACPHGALHIEGNG